MRKMKFTLFSLVLSGSLAWGQAEQKPVEPDPVTAATNGDCADPSGICTKNQTPTPAARDSQEKDSKDVTKWLGTGTVKPDEAPPAGKSPTTK